MKLPVYDMINNTYDKIELVVIECPNRNCANLIGIKNYQQEELNEKVMVMQEARYNENNENEELERKKEQVVDELTQTLGQAFPGATFQAVVPEYSPWQFVFTEKDGFYVRTVYRTARNVIQLLTFNELHQNKTKYIIHEFSTSTGVEHTQVEKWGFETPEERLVPPSYIGIAEMRQHFQEERKKFPKCKYYPPEGL